MTPLKINMKIQLHKEIQDEIAKQLDLKNKPYFRCPDCGEVYKDACGVINCGNCNYVSKDYKKEGTTIIKLKKS
jgi:hypothetical protein